MFLKWHILAALYAIQLFEKKRILKCAWEVLGTLPILPKFGSISMKQGEERKGRVRKGRGGRGEEREEIGK